jgi:hypothetical protein
MAVWIMPGLQCLLCEEFALSRAELALTREARKHQQMIVETTCCARENVRMRSPTEAR